MVVTLAGEEVEIRTNGRPPAGLLGLDVETTYLTDRAQWDADFRVRTVQLATRRVAYVFDLTDEKQRAHVEALLRDEAYFFCSHTNMDVLSIWREFGIDITGRNIDTRGLAISVDPDGLGGRDLKSLATFYGMPEVEAGEAELEAIFRQMWPGKKNAAKKEWAAHGWNNVDVSDPTFIAYAGLDALACRRLVEILIPATGNPAELLDVDQWLHAEANRIQIRGHRVDVPRLEAMLAKVSGTVEQAKLNGLNVTGVNIAGPKVVDWLGEHGVDWDRWEIRTEKGAPSLAKVKRSDFDGHPLDDDAKNLLHHLLELKGSTDAYNKCRAISDRLVDGRIHPLLNPVGAGTTARMSASSPNMQNFSKKNPEHRGLFIPDEGHGFATIDFAQIELRVVAALAREEKMIDTILAGGDLHQLTADEVGIDRQTAKMTNFLIVYGGSGKALHEQAGIPLDEAQDVVARWRDSYPRINALSTYMGMQKGEIRTISNRRLPVTVNKKTGQDRAYANINYLVQSSARELLVDAWMLLDRKFPGVVWWPIHDELVLQAPLDLLDEVMAYAEKTMSFDFMGVPIRGDAIKLIDENGDFRWMPADVAERIRDNA
jgi:DNA polymerase-1